MAGRKKLFNNYIREHVVKDERKDSIITFSFKNLKEEEIPQFTDIGRLVYHAADVQLKKFTPYKIIGYFIKNEKIFFDAHDYYCSIKDGEKRESLGASRTFYQSDLILIPIDFAIKRHRSVS